MVQKLCDMDLITYQTFYQQNHSFCAVLNLKGLYFIFFWPWTSYFCVRITVWVRIRQPNDMWIFKVCNSIDYLVWLDHLHLNAASIRIGTLDDIFYHLNIKRLLFELLYDFILLSMVDTIHKIQNITFPVCIFCF